MTEKDFINKHSEKIADYNTPEQAISQANSCDSLSNDIYTDSKRFIYELLQNADDASCASKKLEFQIDFVGNYIVVSHKGEPFSEIDIKSICSVGDGNKRGDENKTGFKGIGFKSVFSYSEFVIIKSGKYCFKFDKQECNKWNPKWENYEKWKAARIAEGKDAEIKIPWQIIPICTEIPSELVDLSVFKKDEYSVSTIIRHNKTEEIKKSLSDLFTESQIILFLRSNEIKITINTAETLTLEKSVVDDTIILKRNNAAISEWLIKTERFDVPQEVQNQIKDNNRYPRKLRESKRTEISFAVQLEKGEIKATDEDKRLLFTYLPTSINLKLPFLINANFLTDAGRENIHKDLEWNQWIFKQIPLNFFGWIAELADKNSKYSKQIFNIIPRKLSGFNELENNFNDGYNEAIKTIAFIPNQSGNLLKVSEALFDDTNISAFISKQTLISYINRENNKNFSTSSFIPNFGKGVLRELGIEIFKVDDLENFFISDIFSNEHQISENFKLISFLFDQADNSRKKDEESDWNFRLKNIPFIFDEDGKLQKPEHIYFPSVEFSEDFKDDIHIVNETVLEEINKNKRIKNWLEKLGVKEPTDTNFIEKTIIGDSNYITEENAIKIGRYLFGMYKKGVLTDYFDDLQNINILTKQGTLKQASECFLSDFYEPNLRLEKFCDIDFFVSKNYFEEGDLKKQWNAFFVEIGISENIELKSIYINRTNARERYKNFLPFFKKNSTQIYHANSGNVWNNTITNYRLMIYSLIEYTNNYEFSKLFWSKAFETTFIRTDDDKGTASWQDKSNLDENFFEWCVENVEFIPTVQRKCLKSTEIFNNNIPQVNEIAGKYLPILDYDGIVSPEWQEILKFKKQIELDDYLEVLTKISQEADAEEQKENKKRISLIYEKLAELLPNLHLSEKEKLSSWAKDNKILAKNGGFYFPNELSFVTIDGFNADKLIYSEKIPDEKITELFRCWKVKIVDKSNVLPKFSNTISLMESLKNQLEYIAPLIALVAVEKSKSKKEWQEEYQRIKNKLSEISFYETSKIHISYGNEQDVQERSTWANSNKFYYVGNWSKPRVLDGLVEPLCKFLSIRYAERILTVLLSDTFSEGRKYLEEKGFDISLIPDKLKNPEFEEERVPNQTIRQYNQTDEDLGKKGEMIVFEELKRIYSDKYGQIIEEIENGFAIGENLKVIWRNKTENTTANHDFKITENGKEIYIDSKATPYGKNIEKVALYISGNELNLMEKAEKYLIARVYNAFENSSIEFVKLKIDKVAD